MPRTGRPKIQIDWDQFDKLCALQCTRREIASFFEVSEDTIERAVKRKYKVTFAVRSQEKGCAGLISLRRKQYELAMTGDRVMLIWLGKQRLGQSEKVETLNKTTLDARVESIDREELRKANEELESEC